MKKNKLPEMPSTQQLEEELQGMDIESITCKGNEYLGKFYQCGDWSLYEKGTYLQKRASF